MNLIEVAKDKFIDPTEVVSIEHDIVNKYHNSSPSDSSMYESFNGTRITLKNGRKVFVDKVMPSEIIAKLGGLNNG